MKSYLILLIYTLLIGTLSAQELVLPDIEPLELIPEFNLYHHAGLEISGVVESGRQPSLFWFHNDSGNEPRVFPMRGDGSFFTTNRFKYQDGVLLLGASNVDWEDMTKTDDGDLIIADFGNNWNDRHDLLFYVFSEPSPHADFVTVREKIFFKYPDQQAFPDSTDYNYDSEAVFYAQEHLYVLTKNRSDTYTKLYRLDSEEQREVNTLTYVDRFNVQGLVTGADASEDGNTLVLVTYDAIWKFVKKQEDRSYFNGQVYYLPYEAIQIESVCINEDKIMLIDEATSNVYKVGLDQLLRL